MVEVGLSSEKRRAAMAKAATECKELFTEHKKRKKVPRADEQLVGGRNENIPALSAFVELRMSKNMGRGVYATRDINPGK